MGNHAVAGEHGTVLFRLILLKPVTDDHRAPAEHPLDLFDRRLEQGAGIITGGFNVGAGLTFAPENQLKHSLILAFALWSPGINDWRHHLL
jgi:hypothetical protein